jgi:hypothetical protein
MATTAAELDTEQQFSVSPAQATLLAEIAALRRLSSLSTRAAEALSALALEAFTMAQCGETRANVPGNEFLQRAEDYFRQSQFCHSEAEALWRRLGQ